MVNPDLPLFQHPQETWDAETCQKKANHLAKDGLGTPYPWKGYIGQHYGAERYNGGCIRPRGDENGEWFQGEFFPLPNVADGYEIIYVPTWGYRIIPTEHFSNG